LTSTLETDAEMNKNHRPKRKLKRPLRLDSDSSKSDNNEEAIYDKIPSPPKFRTPTKNNTISSEISTMITPCKSSTLTVASPNYLSNMEMNYEKSFSKKSNTSRGSFSFISNCDQSSSKILNLQIVYLMF